ncbi:MAG: class II aldolase/adducin family protein, partial [Flavobacteriales bacterium]|nr:class II aldolase/adducin family protein [Flavobacteriales bacterium]
MKNLWNTEDAEKLGNDLLKLRVYSSRLLGQEENLVLHGGGNTSVKTKEKNIFGEEEVIIYIKGSGWDLATIKDAGFAPVKLQVLQKLAQLETLSDVDMVKNQRTAMTDPSAPNPSVEAILHAIIPHKFVDHTHADAIVTISNTPNGEEKIRDLFGDKVLVVPYVMPGFVLAKQIYQLTKDLDWNSIDGMILLNHGVFTFDDNARSSYEKMISIVTKAENHLSENTSNTIENPVNGEIDSLKIAELRQAVSNVWEKPILAQWDHSSFSRAFSNHPDIEKIATSGPLTPDHIIRTKRTPVILSDNP